MLDLAPIQQPQQNQNDLGKTLLEVQQIKAAQGQGALQQLDLQNKQALPGLATSYGSASPANQAGILAQIAAKDPAMANSLSEMATRQGELKNSTASTNAQVASEGALKAGRDIENKIAAMNYKNAIQDDYLKHWASQGPILQNYFTSIHGIKDPEQAQKVTDMFVKDTPAAGFTVPPELAKYDPVHTPITVQHLMDRANMAQAVYQLRNPSTLPPSIQEFNDVKNLSPEDQQKFAAIKSGMPFMPAPPIDASALSSPGGAQSGTPPFPAPGGGAMGAAAPDAVKLGYVPEFGGMESSGPVPLTPAQQQIESTLARAPPQISGVARAIITGRQPGLQGFVMKSPYGQAVMNLVNAADPSFDMVNYQARQKVREDFASSKLGTTGGNIALVNSTLPLLDKLQQASDKLGGVSSGSLGPLTGLANSAENAYKSGENSVALKDYETQQSITMPEVIKILKSTGGNKEDLELLQKNLNVNSSPDQRSKAISDLVNGLQEKVNTWQQSYQNGMGVASNQPNFLNKRSQGVMAKFGIEGYGPAAAGGGANAASIPEGAKPTGKTIGGKPVYTLPNGKGWIPD